MSEITSFHTKLGEDGRVVIPAAVRKESGLKRGDTIVAESDGHSLFLRSMDEVVREVQAAFAPARTTAGAGDELIAERRAEAAREAAEDEAWLAGRAHD